MSIETQRLRLRPAEEKDIPFLVAGLNDWSIAQWLISPPYPYKEDDARWFINWTNTLDEGSFNGKFVIADKTTDEFLGVITLVPEASRAELGYWLQAAAHKKGYMKEAVKGVVEFAQRTSPNLICFATVDPENYSSERCLVANGFKFLNKYKREKCRRNGTVNTRVYERQL